jgi:hypothetical protein
MQTINQHKMVYGNHKVRMANKKTAPAPAEAGTDSFRKAGPEAVWLREIMVSKGALFNNVTSTTVCAEEPWFLSFKPNSLKANITSLKKEFNDHGNIKGMRKLLLVILFDLTSFTTGAVGQLKDDKDAEPKEEVTEEVQKYIAAAAGRLQTSGASCGSTTACFGKKTSCGTAEECGDGSGHPSCEPGQQVGRARCCCCYDAW